MQGHRQRERILVLEVGLIMLKVQMESLFTVSIFCIFLVKPYSSFDCCLNIEINQ